MVTFWSRDVKESWLQALLSQGAEGPRVTRLPSLHFLMMAVRFSRAGLPAEAVKRLVLADAEAKQYQVRLPDFLQEAVCNSTELPPEDTPQERVELHGESWEGAALARPPSPLCELSETSKEVEVEAAPLEELGSDKELQALLQLLVDTVMEQARLEMEAEEQLTHVWQEQCQAPVADGAALVEHLREQEGNLQEDEVQNSLTN